MQDDSRRIVKFKTGKIEVPLVKPYKLSFTTLKTITSVWVYIEYENGEIGIGEAVPLPGYGHETIKDVTDCIGSIQTDNNLSAKQDLWRRCEELKIKYPFSVSAVITALEFSEWLGKTDAIKPIQLVLPLSSGDEDAVLKDMESGLANGYRHFKMKIGQDVDLDIKSSLLALRAFKDKDYLISFDANKAYMYEDALSFCNALDREASEKCSWVEQLLPVGEWKNVLELSKNTSVKLMLDESIYNESDVIRGYESSCSAVKLKLFKQFGMSDTMNLALKAKELGMNVVIGNGVATDLGNLCEAMIISSNPKMFSNGAECNGFLKLKENVLFPELTFKNGNLCWSGPPEKLQEQIRSRVSEFVTSGVD
jgi:L-alanine-DL-glutamate epimerase-like enolase superfamily enzyme